MDGGRRPRRYVSSWLQALDYRHLVVVFFEYPQWLCVHLKADRCVPSIVQFVVLVGWGDGGGGGGGGGARSDYRTQCPHMHTHSHEHTQHMCIIATQTFQHGLHTHTHGWSSCSRV